jgi:molecular chaperone GrpE
MKENKQKKKKKKPEKKEVKKQKNLEKEVLGLEELIEKISEERDEYKDKYLRSLANYENLMKRTQKEKEKVYNFGIRGVFQEILPVLDDFGRAFNSLEKENGKDGFIKGTGLIYSKLKNILRNYQIEPFDSKGEKFDPKRHDAIHVVVSDKEEGIILEEVEKGYLIKDRLLRPARVIVAKEREDVEEKENKNNEYKEVE